MDLLQELQDLVDYLPEPIQELEEYLPKEKGKDNRPMGEIIADTKQPKSPENYIKRSTIKESYWHAAIAATRFGYGLRPGELQIIEKDPQRWLQEQMDDIDSPQALEGLSQSSDYIQGYMNAKAVGRLTLDEYMMSARQTAMYEIGVHELYAYNTDNPFRERLVRFWRDHFNLPGEDSVIYPMVIQFEREVIRPNLNRSYYQMLKAAYQHPAMLIAHNNDTNVGPISPSGKRRQYRINESLAREILEHHTLGPEGDYTEKDIKSLAAMLTGWSVGGLASKQPGKFLFQKNWHDHQQKKFMGKFFPSAGALEFEAALDLIVRNPRTGWRLAEKMARSFISDTPSEELLKDMVDGYLNAHGNIMAMANGMIKSEFAWSPAFEKVKSPHRLVLSAYKALDIKVTNGRELVRQQTALGQPPLMATTPDGWPEHSHHWLTDEQYGERIAWLSELATTSTIDKPALEHAIEVLGPRTTPRSARFLTVVPKQIDGVAMILTSPEFQKS